MIYFHIFFMSLFTCMYICCNQDELYLCLNEINFVLCTLFFVILAYPIHTFAYSTPYIHIKSVTQPNVVRKRGCLSVGENLSSEFCNQVYRLHSNQPTQLQKQQESENYGRRNYEYGTMKVENNTDADRTAQLRRLICVFLFI